MSSMASHSLKVLGFWPSPFSHRVEWALKLKGIDYEYIEENVFNKSPQLLELNPVYKKVPVLVHDDKILCESFLILEYIDETWNEKSPSLMPQDPYERSMARFWARYAEEKIIGNIWLAMCTQGDQREKAIETIKEALERIEQVLKGKSNFFGGENLGFLDLALGWIPHWFPVWELVGKMEILNKNQFPATILWINNFLNHPVIKEKLPSREDMIVYFKERATIVAALLAAADKN